MCHAVARGYAEDRPVVKATHSRVFNAKHEPYSNSVLLLRVIIEKPEPSFTKRERARPRPWAILGRRDVRTTVPRWAAGPNGRHRPFSFSMHFLI